MCGVAGEFLLREGRPIDPTDLFGMIDVLAHRGPESAGYWINEQQSTVLLHARLSFVDLEGGRQPLADENGELWLSLNGELYEHRQIRKRLEKSGHKLRSTCDAEIVPHLFQDQGEECFATLRGEFAFALVDQSRRELYLVRDRFGIKPLFYALTGDSIVFGSEIKSILSHPEISAEIDRPYLHQSLITLGLPDQSWLKGIRQVKPGHFVHVANGKVEERPYWTLQFGREEKYKSITEAGERFRELFDDAVRLRLDADVEIGCYLSGGLDSATVANSMVKQAPYPVRTFSIRYRENEADESRIAAEIAAHLGAQNTIVDISDAALSEAFIPSLWHGEQIAANSHATAKYLLSAETGRHVKAVMTGEGSDELFAGYGFFTHQSLIEARRAGIDCSARMSQFLKTSATTPSIAPVDDYRRFDLVTDLYGQYPYQALRAILVCKGLNRFFSKDFAKAGSLRSALKSHAKWVGPDTLRDLVPARASQYTWIRSELPAYLLTNLGDRPEMANSVEGRVPFLDNELADFALGLPMDWLADEQNGKLVVRAAMKDILPEAVTEPEKKIFWGPAAKETRLLKSAACSDYLSFSATKTAGIFDPLKISLLHNMIRMVPANSRLGSAARSLLITAASTHILFDLFTKRFESNICNHLAGRRRWFRAELEDQASQQI